MTNLKQAILQGIPTELPAKKYINPSVSHAPNRKDILNKEEIKICENVAKFLKAKNIFFAGIDMIGNKITEINITSPTCLAEINKFHNKDIGKFFWEQLK